MAAVETSGLVEDRIIVKRLFATVLSYAIHFVQLKRGTLLKELNNRIKMDGYTMILLDESTRIRFVTGHLVGVMLAMTTIGFVVMVVIRCNDAKRYKRLIRAISVLRELRKLDARKLYRAYADLDETGENWINTLQELDVEIAANAHRLSLLDHARQMLLESTNQTHEAVERLASAEAQLRSIEGRNCVTPERHLSAPSSGKQS